MDMVIAHILLKRFAFIQDLSINALAYCREVSLESLNYSNISTSFLVKACFEYFF